MAKIPFTKVAFEDDKTSRQVGHVEDALNRLGSQTLDQWDDGKLYRKVLGVNYDNLLTNSGLANSTITAEKILTVSGTSLLPATVPVSALAPCNQLNVYRTAAFTCPAGVLSTLFADSIVKDSGNGWAQANGWYVIPTAGDYHFSWSMALTPANAQKTVYTQLVMNSGAVAGTQGWTVIGGEYLGSVGSYLFVNARAGDKVKVNVFNGDSGSLALSVGSGNNFFTGYQVR